MANFHAGLPLWAQEQADHELAEATAEAIQGEKRRRAEMISGWAWHPYHDCLMEWCWDYDERVAVIKRAKPANEQALRLRLFKMVKGPLPPAVVKAQVSHNKARAFLDKAQVVQDNLPAILALHAQECPDCPWDGDSIFPKKEG